MLATFIQHFQAVSECDSQILHNRGNVPQDELFRGSIEDTDFGKGAAKIHHQGALVGHPHQALEQADGYHDLELANDMGDTGDPFPGNKGNHAWTMVTDPESSSWYGEVACANTCLGVTNISNSGTTMTADLQVTCATPDHWVYLPLVLKNPLTGAALWDQPLSGTNLNTYANQDFSDMPAYTNFGVDDFVASNNWVIASGVGVNIAAAIFFVFSGKVVWPIALVMALGALAGGVLGGRLAGRIKPELLRRLVVAIGVIVAIIYLVR